MLGFVPPRTIGPYEVHSLIGRGGVGLVYRAHHLHTGCPAAVKLLGPPSLHDPSATRRLAREFEALRPLRHRNVIRVFEAGVHEGYSFLAMELVEGLNLRSYLSIDLFDDGAARTPSGDPRESEDDTTDASVSLLRAPGTEAIREFASMLDEPETDAFDYPPLDDPPFTSWRSPDPSEVRFATSEVTDCLNGRDRIARLRDALAQICLGLGYVHEHGLVHRDLKPSNIMVDDERRVRIMDFGLVKLIGDGPHPAELGRVVGTYRYMAPEQARGEAIDHRADLYSLGVILFELLCGQPPFTCRESAQLWREVVSRPAPAVASINSAADPDLARVADRLLAKDPNARFQTAREVGRALSPRCQIDR